MSNAQILVVEDEAIVAKNIQRELTGMGYTVPALASSGEEALRKAAETHPDLVLMDICLKGDKDGVETTKELRAYFDVPVVYLTAYADDQTLERAKATEPFGYLLKPYEERELRTTIEVALYKHRMERLSHEVQHWLSSSLQCLGDAVIITDAAGNVLLTNRQAEVLTGWSADEALGRALFEVFHVVNTQSRALVLNPASEAIRKGGAIGLEKNCLCIAKDGREMRVEGSIAPIQDERGSFTGLVLSFRDISERIRAEYALGQAQKMEALGRMAGGMAHDFNHLLTVIIGHIAMVLTNLPKTDRNRELLVIADKAAMQAGELMKQLLSFARRRRARAESVRLETAVQEMVDFVRGILPAGVTLEYKTAPDLWTIQGDATLLREVVLNLCLNARDAMSGEGQILLEIKNAVVAAGAFPAQPRAAAGDYVCISVQDTGEGMSPEVQARIFEPFFTTKKAGKGSGLGLALVLGIVDEHGGWIECSSEVGKGTRFDVYLPRWFGERGAGEGDAAAEA